MNFSLKAFLACLLAFLPGVVQAAPSGALTIVTEENPPFNYMDKGRLTGSSTEVVRELLRRLDSDRQILILPWARGYRMLETEPNVALFSTTRTPEREPRFQWVGPLCMLHYGFYAWGENPSRIASLAEAKKVGAVATYRNDVKEQLLQSLGFENLDRSNDPESSLKKLAAGRVDLWFYSNIGVPGVAGRIGLDPARLRLVLPFRSYHNYIAFSADTPAAVVERWQETLDDMKRDGSFFRISRKWLPPESIPNIAEAEQGLTEAAAELKLYTEDSPPGNYLKDGEPTGLAVDVVRKILSRLNLPDTIEVVPWARGYSKALTQPRVALFSTTRLPQREKLFHWVGPIYTQTWGFYARKGSGTEIRSLADARAVPRIGTYNKDAKEQFLTAQGFTNLVSANRNVSNVKHLLKGDIDLWVSSDFNMPYLVRKAGGDPEQVEEVLAFRKVDNYIVFSRQTPGQLAAAWQQTLDRIKQDGTYRQICRRYDYYPDR